MKMHKGLLAFVLLMCLSTNPLAAQQERWSALLGSEFGPGFISPTIGNVDGDLSNGKELVVATKDGFVSAFSSVGVLLWRSAVPSVECPGLDEGDRLHSSPTIGVLRVGATPSVVIGYGSNNTPGCSGGLVAFNGINGQERFRFNVASHARRNSVYAFRYGTIGSPAISDYFENGRALIAFGSLSHFVYLLTGTGRVRYFYNTADTVLSSPTFYLDAAGRRRFAIGQDISSNANLRPPTRDGGFLNIFSVVKPPGARQIPFREVDKSGKRGLVAFRYFDQVVQSSPAVANIVPSSRGPEIAITTGCFFPQGVTPKSGNYLTLLNQDTKRKLATFPLSVCSATNPLFFPALGLIGVLDNGLSQNGGPGFATVMVLEAVIDSNNIQLKTIWKHDLPSTTQWQSVKNVTFSDGRAGLVVFSGNEIYFYQATDGLERGRFSLGGGLDNASLATGDINGDGIDEVAAVVELGREVRVHVISVP